MYDLRSEVPSFFNRYSGGRGVIVCGAVLSEDRSSFAITTGSINSKVYNTVSEDFLLPFACSLHVKDFIFMQYNA